ncbi:hypothetical protein [Ancylobacter rudongensis]|uniref:Uncharacterized protein n=1 Tax=Ancylobacter rudongensis TaxID=177413 RepID=A0A1G4UPC0_9HYPH|nr:hypothetical protein [Ancylobacter rudongensis]SCW95488.1 hypothetical protein SAMN05660859_0040 [Ancylobacter rudongensis]
MNPHDIQPTGAWTKPFPESVCILLSYKDYEARVIDHGTLGFLAMVSHGLECLYEARFTVEQGQLRAQKWAESALRAHLKKDSPPAPAALTALPNFGRF